MEVIYQAQKKTTTESVRMLRTRPSPLQEQNDAAAAKAAALAESGHGVITSTKVRGQPALRLCTINPRTSIQDVSSVLQRLGVRIVGEQPAS